MAKRWHDALTEIKPYVFKISTPRGSGTGFQLTFSPLWGIATAYHVIEHANEWGETIKLTHHASQQTITLKEGDGRIIIPFPAEDLAFIIMPKSLLPDRKEEIPTTDQEMIRPGRIMKEGAEIGWCGFPSVARKNLCFFHGSISAFLGEEGNYLVDGVAINGVSGGPAFYIDAEDKIRICGVISAYMPNVATGDTLPGLSVVTAVKPYQTMVQTFKDLEEAQKKAEEQQKEIEKQNNEKSQTDSEPRSTPHNNPAEPPKNSSDSS